MTRTGSQSIEDYLASIGSRTSTPGGGAVAAVFTAEACALLEMVLNFTNSDDTRLVGMNARLEASRNQLPVLADSDMQAFDEVMNAYKGKGGMQLALSNAAAAPIAVMDICESHVEDACLLAEVGNSNLITDVAIAASLLSSGLDACEVNVLVNVKSMTEGTEALTTRLIRVPSLKRQLAEIVAQVKAGLS